jgi:hypothetical protein
MSTDSHAARPVLAWATLATRIRGVGFSLLGNRENLVSEGHERESVGYASDRT